MLKVLITGGCGFIGTNLVSYLKNNSDNIFITVVDNFSNVSRYNTLLVTSLADKLIRNDINDLITINRDYIKYQDVIIHLAADTAVIKSVSEPWFSFKNNTQTTFRLLNYVKNTNVKKFIFASTGGAIQGETNTSLNETDPCKPMSPYGASKLCGEAYCSAFSGSYGLDSLALRFTNVYGRYSNNKDTVISIFYKNILKKDHLHIYGDGEQIRDYVHVTDLCRAIKSAIYTNIKGFEAINIASGEEISILDLLEKIRIITNIDPFVLYKPKRPGEIFKNSVCIDKAKKLLNYNPLMNIDEGLIDTWQWFEENIV